MREKRKEEKRKNRNERKERGKREEDIRKEKRRKEKENWARKEKVWWLNIIGEREECWDEVRVRMSATSSINMEDFVR